MKTKLSLAVSTVVICAALAVFVSGKVSDNNASSFAVENVEALSQAELDPAIIECSSGNLGTCFIISDTRNFGIFYSCRYTGRQSDYCDLSHIIAQNLFYILFE